VPQVDPAVICFTVVCALVLVYVVIARPGVRDGGSSSPRAGDQRPAAAVQTPGSVEGRNRQRLEDLRALRNALDAYARANNGAFVSTNGNFQTLCTYERLDAGCALNKHLDRLPADPTGPNFGYFYQSDGKSYVLGAQWEGDADPPADFQCPASFKKTQDSPMVCVEGKRD
jgi:hypothetical protein